MKKIILITLLLITVTGVTAQNGSSHAYRNQRNLSEIRNGNSGNYRDNGYNKASKAYNKYVETSYKVETAKVVVGGAIDLVRGAKVLKQEVAPSKNQNQGQQQVVVQGNGFTVQGQTNGSVPDYRKSQKNMRDIQNNNWSF